MFNRWMLILVLLLPISLIFEANGPRAFAEDRADIVEGEEDVNVEDDQGNELPADDGALSGKDAEEDEASVLKSSPDADTHFLFTKPTGMGLDLPAGKDVSFLVGFVNKGQRDLVIDSMEASFRYAMDFNFHLQNFTAIAYNRVVKPREEATLAYSFFVSEAYSTRPYGLTVNLFFKDAEGKQYVNAVFNETVSIVELDEGLDGETFFLYVVLGAVVVLLLVGLQQLMSTYGKKHLTSKPKVEMGTANHNDVDYDWLPEGTLNSLSKSPKASKQSPRQRRVKRATGSADD